MNARWLKYLPGFLRRKLEGRHGLQAVLGNSSWLFADKILRMIVGLLVGVWIVRYLGPTQYGLLSYSIAFAGIFGPFASLGLESIVVHEILKDPKRTHVIMGSAFVLKLVGGAITLLVTIAAILMVRGNDPQMLWLVGLCAAGYLFQAFNVIDFHFQSQVKAKFIVIAATSAFAIVTAAKIALLVVGASLVEFAIASLVEVVLTSLFLIIAYQRNSLSIREWRFDTDLARALLLRSWPLVLGTFAAMIYMRIDQVIIGQLLGDKDVGLFSAAVRVSELWYFVPWALASSIFPTIIASKQMGGGIFNARLQSFFTVMLWIAIGMAVFVMAANRLIISVLYGSAFADSATVLSIHIWAGLFVALSAASSGWMIMENLQKLMFYRSVFAGIVNIILNFLLIPRFGIIGSAIALVVAQACTSLFADFFHPETRPLFWMKLRALNPMGLLKGF